MTLGELLPLLGIPIVVAGFALRLNPLLVVVVSAIVTGLATGISPLDLLELIGAKFLGARSLTIFVLVLPVIGLLERYGLRAQAARTVARVRGASAGRILLCYLAFRQMVAALGLPGIGGQAAMVRPLLVPMLEGAAAISLGPLPEAAVQRIRAEAAATENIALFFGEDIFIAFGGVLLMDAFLRENGIRGVQPLTIGLWAIPSAIAAFLIQALRVARLNAALTRDAAERPAA